MGQGKAVKRLLFNVIKANLVICILQVDRNFLLPPLLTHIFFDTFSVEVILSILTNHFSIHRLSPSVILLHSFAQFFLTAASPSITQSFLTTPFAMNYNTSRPNSNTPHHTTLTFISYIQQSFKNNYRICAPMHPQYNIGFLTFSSSLNLEFVIYFQTLTKKKIVLQKEIMKI